MVKRVLLIVVCLLVGAVGGYGVAALRHSNSSDPLLPVSDDEYNQLLYDALGMGQLTVFGTACQISTDRLWMVYNVRVNRFDLTREQREELGRWIADGVRGNPARAFPVDPIICGKRLTNVQDTEAAMLSHLQPTERARALKDIDTREEVLKKMPARFPY